MNSSQQMQISQTQIHTNQTNNEDEYLLDTNSHNNFENDTMIKEIQGKFSVESSIE
jgi:hypothetical protein